MSLSSVQLDRFQQPIAERLKQLARQIESLETMPRWRQVLGSLLTKQSSKSIKGLYIWGGVGRGKTYLMDRFYQEIKIDRKTRMHFHQFMQSIHQQLHSLTSTENPLEAITAKIAKETRLLCFDEFVVSDIGDAMLLSELLTCMFKFGIVLVTTSNIEPKELYKDGLQRRRFLPAIGLLQQYCKVILLDGSIDYRLRAFRRTTLYRIGTELTPSLQAQDMLLFDLNSVESTSSFILNHREIQTVFASRGVVGFMFEELCATPRNTADYIEIARLFHTVFIYEIPQLATHLEDAAKRFINLIDVLYDYNVNIVIQAEAIISELYVGSRLTKEFERTASRIVEMASEEFLSRAHRA